MNGALNLTSKQAQEVRDAMDFLIQLGIDKEWWREEREFFSKKVLEALAIQRYDCLHAHMVNFYDKKTPRILLSYLLSPSLSFTYSSNGTPLILKELYIYLCRSFRIKEKEKED